MTLWISVGLLSFWMVILKRVTRLGGDIIPAVFKPLLTPPQGTINSEVDELNINDLDDLDPDTVGKIQERVKTKLDKNKEHTRKAVNTYQGLFKKIYGLLSTLANVTSDSVRVYLKLFSVKDANQWRLVRSNMSSIFKHSVRWALNLNASDSSQSIFGGDSNV